MPRRLRPALASLSLGAALLVGAALPPAVPLLSAPAQAQPSTAGTPVLSIAEARAAATRILEAVKNGDANARFAQFSDDLKAMTSPAMVQATMRSQPKVLSYQLLSVRSGLSTSTRKKAIALWCNQLPMGDPEQMAKVLFSYENPPGTVEIAGSQDAIGIVMPGLNRSEYAGGHWPRAITSDGDESRLAWLEARLWLVPLDPRESGYRVLSDTNVSVAGATALANAADACWHGIQSMDAARTGAAMTASYEAQIAMFPHMVARDVPAMIERYRTTALGWKLSGAGGGGYLTLFSEQPITGALRVKIRRRHSGL